MARDKNIDNSRSHDLTIEEIKACRLFSHFTNQQAEDVIKTLKQFTRIAYDLYKKETEKFENKA